MLGVARDADAQAIRDAFRTLALKYHPDRNREPGAEERFKAVAEAYAVLSDPRKRAEYDARGFAGVAGFSPEDLFGGIDLDDLFASAGFDLGGGLFERFFHRRHGLQRGANLEVGLRLSLERIASGGEENVHFSRPVPCPDCHGSGAESGTRPRTCASCGGSGRVIHTRREQKDHDRVMVQQIRVCPECGGKGKIVDHPCSRCGGRGETGHQETLTVTIPAGVEEGMALRISGHGLPSPESGGPPGDLFVVVHSIPDMRFQRDGADLWHDETLSVPDAVLGVEREVPTLDGTVSVTVPAGTQPDSVLRLRGKGLPQLGGGRGDLYVRIKLQIPHHPSGREQELYRQLRDLPP